MLTYSREQRLQGDVIAAIEQKHRNGDVVLTVRGLCATLVDYVCFREPSFQIGTDSDQITPN